MLIRFQKGNIWMKSKERKKSRTGAYLLYVTARGICTCKERSDGIAHCYGVAVNRVQCYSPNSIFGKNAIFR